MLDINNILIFFSIYMNKICKKLISCYNIFFTEQGVRHEFR